MKNMDVSIKEKLSMFKKHKIIIFISLAALLVFTWLSFSKRVFFKKLQSIADTGDLFDPQGISKLLKIDFTTQTTEQVPQPAVCSNAWDSRSTQITKATADEFSWYRVSPIAVMRIREPSMMVNPTKSGRAELRYHILRKKMCTDQTDHLLDHASARLTFAGLPSFTCISISDIKRYLPKAKCNMVHDSIFQYTYQGRVDDNIGTNLTFGFRLGTNCAQSISITQDQESGLKYKRAESKRLNCKVHSDREFCENYEPSAWTYNTFWNGIARYADKKCGTIDSLFKQDTEIGTQPAPLPVSKTVIRPCQYAP